ncbi:MULTISPECIES: transketolase [unclassified Mesorhizobium]|uniref:transketolase n=1 Tax=unclassified Mesorhizobium TaxID=325217 RepID=UPI000FD26572|nr:MULTISPECIES: transketolase [unclassified Mesorhizobium]RVB79041.1 transketolase [Mesorhizobium sp. M6A.T.Cr.TU.014.01.1.1]RWP82287.1 MAG: transketolase [Mesorhizobium sp.]RWQ09989.1 MAG: transketolase [Mesorhizobium sp.]RWQ11298.1 MAG: transketolase [Mesorhizobium sp.]
MNSQAAALKPVAAVSERDMANAIRALAMDSVQKANSGHPGMPMGMADVATVLFGRFINIDPSAPNWPDRDRFVLSAGHGSMLQYALHYLLGFEDMPIEELQRFRQLGSRTAGHPEYGHALGIETTTGPLGQGISTAVGMALAERMLAARHGADLVDHFTYVIAGDGCLQEGISHEAIDLAGHLKLSRLIVFWDDNAISIDGPTSLSTSMDQPARFKAAGWHVQSVDGHDTEAVAAAIEAAQQSDRPSLIACRTVIGKGAPNLGGSEKTHGAPLGDAEIAATRENIDWAHAPFEVPDDILFTWREVAERGQAARHAWEQRLAASSRRQAFESAVAGNLPDAVFEALGAFRKEHLEKATKVATRKASEMALGAINAATDLTVGGSADLTHSNLTITKGMDRIAPDDYAGRYIHYGIREHGMAAAMNGIALHGGFVPYGGTFLCFADYARGAMRLSALMGQRVVYVMTHDSIGLGEDGPTHQPVEHLAMLRATPNLNVFRPADIIETAECWELALKSKNRPSVLVLSRQNLPMLRQALSDEPHSDENRSSQGAYILREPSEHRAVTLIATGSEVEIAVAAAERLEAEHGIAAAVVSMPCWELFEEQDADYRKSVLGSAPRIAVEAAARLGWDRWIGDTGAFVGMAGFGASAPAPDLYRHFDITPEAIAAAALKLII